jgi:hypothetical protein
MKTLISLNAKTGLDKAYFSMVRSYTALKKTIAIFPPIKLLPQWRKELFA